MDSSEAIIYLSASRGSTETGTYRSLSTLKEKPFYTLSIVNDETLAGAASVKHKVEQKFFKGSGVDPGFDIERNKNIMVPLSPDVHLHIGKFDGRRDGILNLRENAIGFFAFVIEGAFEVQNCLLHSRDGLGLSNVKQIEFEALSNDAILLIIELQEASHFTTFH